MDTNEKCCIDQCSRTIWVKKHGLCRAHYYLYRKHGFEAANGKIIKDQRTLKPFKLLKYEHDQKKERSRLECSP